MRAADFISQDMLKDMLEDMVPETSNSIECCKIYSLPGNDRNPMILAEVINGNGFSDYPDGTVVMVPENSFITIPIGRRLFVRVKSIAGKTKGRWKNEITDRNRGLL